MGGIKSRKSPRAQVTLVARYRSPTAFEFVHEECFDLSAGGMFIKSRSPAPSGTLLKLECDVDGGTAKIRGVARVVWLREQDSDGHPAGMGVKFVKLDPGGREVIAAILDRVGANVDEQGVARRSSVPPRGSQPYRPTPLPGLAAAAAPAAAPASPEVLEILAAAAPAALAAPAKDPEADAVTLRPAPIEPAPAVAPAAAKAPTPAPAPEPKAKTPAPAATPPPAASKDSGKSKAKGKGKKKGKKESGRPRAKEAAATPSGSGRPASAPRSVEPVQQATQRRGGRVMVYVAAAAIAGLATYALASRHTAEVEDPGGAESVAATEEPATQEPAMTAAAPEVTKAEPPAVAPSPAVAPAAPEPAPTPPSPHYVLEVVTRPEGAQVSIAGQRIVTPGELKLGTLEEPVVVKAEKKGYLSAAATIDRVGFMLDEGVMRRRVVFNLSEAGDADEPRRSRREKAPPPSEKPKPEEPALAAVAQSAPKAPPAEEPQVEEPKAEPKPVKQTPMQAAMACLGNGDNGCVVAALEGKARSAQELELLIETHRAMGHAEKAEKYMHTYLSKYPSERRAANYKRVLERRAGDAEAAP